MAKKMSLESPSEKLCRQAKNRVQMAKQRALKSPSDTICIRKRNHDRMAEKRTSIVSIDHATSAFISKIKIGPDFVCTCCHRMMYKQMVLPFNKFKYTKASNQLLEQVFSNQYLYTSSHGQIWLCRTCDTTLSRGNMPVQAKANNLQLDEIPTELSTLNALELRLISLRVPFMKMVALPSGKQRSIQGPAVNVPSKLDSLCTMLPRLPTRSQLVPLK